VKKLYKMSYLKKIVLLVAVYKRKLLKHNNDIL